MMESTTPDAGKLQNQPASNAGAGSITELPLHLLRDILTHLHTVDSLVSCAQSHRSFYAAYSDNPVGLISGIIDRQIPRDVRPYCAAACFARTSRVDVRSPESIRAFLAEHVASGGHYYTRGMLRFLVPDTPTLRRMSTLHVAVEHFTQRFLEYAAEPAHHVFGAECFFRPPTEMELLRIQRALYMFELYCRLFCIRHQPLPGETVEGLLADSFHNSFSPWVREQIASMFRYLRRTLSTSFMQVHEDLDRTSQPTLSAVIQDAFVSRGLLFLYQVDTAADAASKRLVFYPDNKTRTLPAVTRRAVQDLERTISTFKGGHPTTTTPLHLWQTAELVALERPGTDGIEGYLSPPFMTWARAHATAPLPQAVDSWANRGLQRSGYVFWDARPLWHAETDAYARLEKAKQMFMAGSYELDGWWPEDEGIRATALAWARSGRRL